MKRLVLLLCLFVLMPALLYGQALQAESGKITFKVKQLGFNVKGEIGGFTGKLYFDPLKPEKGSLEGKVQVATLETGIDARDNHLKSDDFFDAKHFPEISMKSKKLTKTEKGYKGIFDLTIKEVTKEIEIDFNFNEGVLSSEFEIDRLVFGVGKKGIVMGKTAYVTVEVKTAH